MHLETQQRLNELVTEGHGKAKGETNVRSREKERLKRHKSPCIDVCQFSGPIGWCLGCGRTRDECQKWKALKPYARKILQKELHERMIKINDLQTE